jgi:hypothetical protein
VSGLKRLGVLNHLHSKAPRPRVKRVREKSLHLISRDGGSLVARQAHNLKVESSNLSPATIDNHLDAIKKLQKYFKKDLQ